MNRLDQLAESNLQSRIDALKTAITDLKTSQFAGSANLVTERRASGANFDFVATVKYQTTTAYELTVDARDTTFQNNPFIWQAFWNVVNAPTTTGFYQFFFGFVAANGQQKIRLYLWGTDAPNLPEDLQIRLVLYGLNIGAFSIVQII